MVVLLWLLVVEHVYALVTPPYEPGIEHAFHLAWGLAYAWFALRWQTVGRTGRVVLTALLAVQLVGRVVVFAAIDETWIRLSMVPGALITVVVLVLLWRPGVAVRMRRDAPTAWS